VAICIDTRPEAIKMASVRCALRAQESACAGMHGTAPRSRSGGLQEEAPALGRPPLILRASTERPEAVASGNALLVKTSPERIVTETLHLFDDSAAYALMSVPSFRSVPQGRRRRSLTRKRSFSAKG